MKVIPFKNTIIEKKKKEKKCANGVKMTAIKIGMRENNSEGFCTSGSRKYKIHKQSYLFYIARYNGKNRTLLKVQIHSYLTQARIYQNT